MTQFTYFINRSDDDCHLTFMNGKCFLGYNCLYRVNASKKVPAVFCWCCKRLFIK